MKSLLILFFVLMGMASAFPASATGSGRYSSHAYSHSYGSGTHSYGTSSHSSTSGHNSTTSGHYSGSGYTSAGHTSSTGISGTHSASGGGHTYSYNSKIVGNSTYFKTPTSGARYGTGSSSSLAHKPSPAGPVKKPASTPTPAASSKPKPGPYLPASPTFMPTYGQ